MSRSQTPALLSFLVILSLFSFAQDSHTTDGPAKNLMQRSSWAHGYMHGYEAGFHSGNLDLHMTRTIRDPRSVKDYHHAGKCYRPKFGTREGFENGYSAGFEVGYLDGAMGKEFRAAKLAQGFSEELNSIADSAPSNRVDVMIQSGYQAGRHGGLSDARERHNFNPNKSGCPDELKNGASCPAYLIGYHWGYSDGFSNQRTESNTQRASR